jgi:hypothetical protein
MFWQLVRCLHSQPSGGSVVACRLSTVRHTDEYASVFRFDFQPAPRRNSSIGLRWSAPAGVRVCWMLQVAPLRSSRSPTWYEPSTGSAVQSIAVSVQNATAHAYWARPNSASKRHARCNRVDDGPSFLTKRTAPVALRALYNFLMIHTPWF